MIMAKLIPPYLCDEIKSSGERFLFGKFEADPGTSDWTVLHSLNLNNHVKRLYGEIDFVVLAPGLGIFCIEVKSGGVKRENGVWYYTNRFGVSSTSTRGPFNQAREGMFSLMSSISQKFGDRSRLSRLLFGYGVFFPDIRYDAVGPEEEQWQVYDISQKIQPISAYIKELAKMYAAKYSKQRWFNSSISLPDNNSIDELVSYLRRDFEILPSFCTYINDTEQTIRRFTNEQLDCLDAMDHNKRCLFMGRAGTGKTVIAIEDALRSLAKGKKVRLICFNSYLGSWLRFIFKDNPHMDRELSIDSFHSLLKKIVGDGTDESHDTEKYFTEVLPEKFLSKSISEELLCDKLIIDEGQDLIRKEYLKVMDKLVHGGLSRGEWDIFSDFGKQIIYNSHTEDEMLAMLEELSSFSIYRLTINCRNTKPIGEEIRTICRLEYQEYLSNRIYGEPVSYYFFENWKDEAEKIEKLINGLLSSSVKAERITILSPFRLENSVISKLIKRLPITIYDKRKYEQIKDFIQFSTIHSYKGLENSIIILIDIEKIDGDEFQNLLYVGMSRARASLYVFLTKGIENEYNQIIRHSLEKPII